MQRFFMAAIGRHIEKRATADNLLRAQNVRDFWQCATTDALVRILWMQLTTHIIIHFVITATSHYYTTVDGLFSVKWYYSTELKFREQRMLHLKPKSVSASNYASLILRTSLKNFQLSTNRKSAKSVRMSLFY